MDSVAQPGAAAPDFELTDLDGVLHRLSDLQGTIVLLNFWSAECPHSIRTDALLRALQAGWGERVQVWWVAVNPNESRQALIEAAAERRVSPLLLDTRQELADRYGAETTPHLFLIDAEGVLRYAGAPDDVRFGQPQPTQAYLAEAVDSVLSGRPPARSLTPAFGCAIVRTRA